jgi:TRAP-type uncharacterized transport system fused permease subunit
VVGAIVGRLLPQRAAAVNEESEQQERPEPLLHQLRTALDDGATSLVVVGILLAGAQILVSMINLTGIGVTLSSMIVGEATASVLTVGLVVALICMIMGMGIPTTAAYVLVAATLAPALIKAGVSPLAAHMFVFYFATLSVITPPVCVGVFVAAGIAGVGWGSVAKRAVALGAVTYVIPFLFLLYPGMLTPESPLDFIEAALSGIVFVTGFAYLFGGAKITGVRALDVPAWLGVALVAIYPHPVGLVVGAGAIVALVWLSHRRYPVSEGSVATA